MKFKIFLTFLILPGLHFFSQNNIDSLRNVISSATNDSTKSAAYTQIANHYINEPVKALEVISEMDKFCETIKNQKHKAFCLRKIGTIYHKLSYFDKGLEYNFSAAKIFDKLGDKEGLANCYNNIATAYNDKGDLSNNKLFFDRAVEFHKKSIGLRKELNDTIGIKNSYNNLALVYLSTKEYEKALTYLMIPYEYYKRLGTDEHGIDMTTSNIGEVYYRMGLQEKKPEYFRKAMFYFEDRLRAYQKHKNPSANKANILLSIGQVYFELGQPDRGMAYLHQSHEMFSSLADKAGIADVNSALSSAYEKGKDYKKSLEYLRAYIASKDSLLNERNISSVEQMQVLYNSSQKDNEIERLNKNAEISVLLIHRQRTIMFSVIGGLALLLLLGFVLLSRYNLKKKANLELSKAYDKIESKNRQITDSINYAKRLQSTILPPKAIIEPHLKKWFVFYQPKDIVSGDFYWFTHHNNKSYMVVADCTGHGIPGALMSMIGNTLLNEIINQKDVSDAGEILNLLNKGVIHALRQQGQDKQSQDDGMDISICSFDDTNKTLMNYASANHSIFVKSGNSLKELTGDLHSIGGNFDNSPKKFVSNSVQLQPGDTVVMSTDGYFDQFGGEKNTKFLVKRFEDLIMKTDFSSGNADLVFEKEISNWKGNHKQTDDILVVGFSI